MALKKICLPVSTAKLEAGANGKSSLRPRLHCGFALLPLTASPGMPENRKDRPPEEPVGSKSEGRNQ